MIVTTLSRHLSFLLCILRVDFIVCAIVLNVYPEEGDLIIISVLDSGFERVVITDLIKFTNSVRLKLLASTPGVACQIDRFVCREGEPIMPFLSWVIPLICKNGQLAPNLFRGREDRLQRSTNPDTNEAHLEYTGLDGVLVFRRDAFFPSVGVFIGSNRYADTFAYRCCSRKLIHRLTINAVYTIQLCLKLSVDGQREPRDIFKIAGRSDYLPPIWEREMMDIEEQMEMDPTTLMTDKPVLIEVVYSRQTCKHSQQR